MMRGLAHRLPIVTVLVIASCAYTFAWQNDLVSLPQPIETWLAPCSRAAIDAHLWHTTLSYAWLHMNWAHLIGNMSLMWACAAPFETSCGHVRCAVAYLAGAVAGAFAFAFVREPNDPFMLIGASGAVFSIVGAYAVALAKAHRSSALGSYARQALSRSLAWVVRLVCINLVYGLFLAQGVSNMAHVGGLVTGALIAMLTIRSPRHPRRQQVRPEDHMADPIRWP